MEQAFARGRRYRRLAIVFPSPNGDTRERVAYFAEEADRARMIGFHRIYRESGAARGETIVFDPGPDTPLQGRTVSTPADTYTYLALSGVLGAPVPAGEPRHIHVWLESGATVPAEIRLEGRELLELLGTRVESLRWVLDPDRAPRALYWISADPPHFLLQYLGPVEILGSAAPPPTLLLRATSSSEQVRRLFQSPAR